MASHTAQSASHQALFDLSFYGHGYSGEGRGYSSVLLTYHGGREGRIAAVQRYQRQLRPYVPGRDGQLLSNTWGDRPSKSSINEAFIRKEIEAGQSLGMDIVQVDDGWEEGNTINTVTSGGVWENFHGSDPNFWEAGTDRFPHGMGELSRYAEQRGLRLGLWFAPDSCNKYSRLVSCDVEEDDPKSYDLTSDAPEGTDACEVGSAENLLVLVSLSKE